jgi:hypothetical protein
MLRPLARAPSLRVSARASGSAGSAGGSRATGFGGRKATPTPTPRKPPAVASNPPSLSPPPLPQTLRFGASELTRPGEETMWLRSLFCPHDSSSWRGEREGNKGSERTSEHGNFEGAADDADDDDVARSLARSLPLNLSFLLARSPLHLSPFSSFNYQQSAKNLSWLRRRRREAGARRAPEAPSRTPPRMRVLLRASKRHFDPDLLLRRLPLLPLPRPPRGSSSRPRRSSSSRPRRSSSSRARRRRSSRARRRRSSSEPAPRLPRLRNRQRQRQQPQELALRLRSRLALLVTAALLLP